MSRTRRLVMYLSAAALVAMGAGRTLVIGQTPSSTPAAPVTSWGHPDLQGLWTGSTITPLQRPKQFADKAVLSPDEAAALERAAREQASKEPSVSSGDPGTYNQVWFDPASAVVPDRRTSLIVDPPDGRIPFTPAGLEHFDRSNARYGVGPRDTFVDLDTGERCLSDGMPIPYYTGYNNNYRIIQTKETVVMVAEMFRERRIIPLDARPRTAIPQWLGESRGRWEGQTLVVETSGFTDGSHYWWATSWRAARPSLKVTERFTRVDATTLDYEFTMDDPQMFARPWTARFPLTTDQASRGVTQGPLYEYACHEGNHSIVNVLSGARALEGGARTGTH